MKYLFQLLPHANIHYQDALKTLAASELHCILSALELDGEINVIEAYGTAFLSFETEELSPAAIERISMHSALLMLCRQEGELLRPLPKADLSYVPRDLAEVLKYKGKTSATFTAMMINCALASSRFFTKDGPVTVLDPVCGKGTTAFCALQRGMNAAGVDLDENDLAEADRYFERYLKLHHLKHQRSERSLTLSGKGVRQVVYTLADTKEHYQSGDTRTLTLTRADTAQASGILRKSPAEILVADLPYGIQHAPVNGRKPESFHQLLRRALPAWHEALKPGGAIALSFNTLTLPRAELHQLAEQAGFEPVHAPTEVCFRHFVEQAVTRDVLIARRP